MKPSKLVFGSTVLAAIIVSAASAIAADVPQTSTEAQGTITAPPIKYLYTSMSDVTQTRADVPTTVTRAQVRAELANAWKEGALPWKPFDYPHKPASFNQR
ncbi:DUF4148 domain-containing protein [Cupriavidus oxalaticus]|uniref:DUF4148 domain-containing protein n=1 Tax=Cupriavidus oxalaticus TaxID=96344 RepID=UPI003F741361